MGKFSPMDIYLGLQQVNLGEYRPYGDKLTEKWNWNGLYRQKHVQNRLKNHLKAPKSIKFTFCYFLDLHRHLVTWTSVIDDNIIVI